MTLKKKILAGYGIVFLLMSLVVGWSIVHLVWLGRASHAILRENYQSIIAAEQMLRTLEQQHRSLLLLRFASVDPKKPPFQQQESVFRQWLIRAKNNITIAGEDSLVQAIEIAHTQYQQRVVAWLTQPHSKPTTTSPPLASTLGSPPHSLESAFSQAYQACVALHRLNEKTMYEASEQAKRLAKRAIGSTIVVVGAALFLALLLSLLLSEYIVRGLKEVEKLKSEFFMTASHELRTPLTGIGMSIDLLLERAVQRLDNTEQELLHVAHDEVQRMKTLVSDLLDLTKIEVGRIEMQVSSISVQTLFQHTSGIFKSQLSKKSVTLTVALDKDIPHIRADANKITWVLTNLISNALRYVQEGGHIHITAHCDGAFVCLSVSDDGPGIPLEYQTKIFQKFVQVKGQEAGGTGLGLAICQEIVHAHGGTIWVESAVGRGSTFRFTLPIS